MNRLCQHSHVLISEGRSVCMECGREPLRVIQNQDSLGLRPSPMVIPEKRRRLGLASGGSMRTKKKCPWCGAAVRDANAEEKRELRKRVVPWGLKFNMYKRCTSCSWTRISAIIRSAP